MKKENTIKILPQALVFFYIQYMHYITVWTIQFSICIINKTINKIIVAKEYMKLEIFYFPQNSRMYIFFIYFYFITKSIKS